MVRATPRCHARETSGAFHVASHRNKADTHWWLLKFRSTSPTSRAKQLCRTIACSRSVHRGLLSGPGPQKRHLDAGHIVLTSRPGLERDISFSPSRKGTTHHGAFEPRVTGHDWWPGTTTLQAAPIIAVCHVHHDESNLHEPLKQSALFPHAIAMSEVM